MVACREDVRYLRDDSYLPYRHRQEGQGHEAFRADPEAANAGSKAVECKHVGLHSTQGQGRQHHFR